MLLSLDFLDLSARAKKCENIRWFFGLFAFEIYWPLDNCKISLIRKKIRRSDTTLQYVAHVICTVIVHSGSLNKQLTMEYKWGQKGSKNSKQQTKTAVFRDSEIIYSNLLTIQTQQMLAFRSVFDLKLVHVLLYHIFLCYFGMISR